MAAIGTIYVLANLAIPGLVKVGKTTRSVDARIKELSSATGVPSEFMLIYEQTFLDVDNAEGQIHVILESRGYRHASNREFFNAKPSDVIKIINSVKESLDYNKTPNLIKPEHENGNLSLGDELEGFDGLIRVDDKAVIDNYIWYELWEEAENHYYGFNGYLQDYTEAINVYLKAARLGCPYAFQRLGCIYLRGDSMTKTNRSRALSYFKQGVKSGDYYCFLKMGQMYHVDNNYGNMEKCLDSFIEKCSNKDILIENENNFGSRLAEFLVYIYEKFDFTERQRSFIRESSESIVDAVRISRDSLENGKMLHDEEMLYYFKKLGNLNDFVKTLGR